MKGGGHMNEVGGKKKIQHVELEKR